MLKHPPDEYRPLTEEQLAAGLDIAFRLNSRWLPKERKGVPPLERAASHNYFASMVAKHLKRSNYVQFHGPPERNDFRTPSSKQ